MAVTHFPKEPDALQRRPVRGQPYSLHSSSALEACKGLLLCWSQTPHNLEENLVGFGDAMKCC